MIDRYSTEQMQNVWSNENKLAKWLEVEILSLEAFAKKGIVPKAVPTKIRQNAKVNSKLMLKIEKETKHDVIAFTRMISESLGPEKKWFHYMLTSTDVVDTAFGAIYKEANTLILKQINAVLATLKKQAKKHEQTPCIGRTHGVHAEPTSFGLKFAIWFDEMNRNKVRFIKASKAIEQGKISGAVGNFANTKPYVQDYVCKKLKITSSKISTQVLQRDNHAEYFSTLAIIGTTLEKIALEIRSLQRTEVKEVFEGFSKNQKGSSAMPHKKNPIGSENICGQARLLRAYAQSSLENNGLWHERDISHSSVERVIGPDATATVEYSLKRMNKILSNIIVDKKQMIKNINLTNGVIFSQRVLTYLIETKGYSREKAYDLVQKIAKNAFEKESCFKTLLLQSKDVKISEKELENLFDLNFYMKEVNNLYKRVGIK